MDGYGGLIEFSLAIAFVLGWCVLELVGLRLDKKRKSNSLTSTERSGHPER